jgi:hypothetical protein
MGLVNYRAQIAGAADFSMLTGRTLPAADASP